MATKPAKNPFVVKPASHFLLDLYAQNIAVNPAAHAARVETVPAKPQDQAAADGDGQVVRQHGRSAISLESATEARTKYDGASQGDKSADGMDHSGSGEIMETHSQRRPNVAIAAH